jgi:multidrug resistance efflux pump
MAKKRRVLVGAGLAVALAVLAGWFALSWYQRDEQMVLAGTIEARDAEVGSLVGGRVAAVLVSEGTAVRAGDPIVRLETDLGQLEIQRQKAVVEQARASVAKVRAGPRSEEVTRAEVEADGAERERRRLERLLAEGMVPRQQYDDAMTRARTALETYRELARGSRPEDIRAAEAALESEEQRLAFLIRQSEEAIVRAPADGVIETLDLRPGDLVAANQPVARVLEPSQLWVRVFVPEPLLGRVRLGQEVAIRVDTFRHREFPGRVVEIRQQGEYTPRNVQTLKQRMDQVFGVKVAVDPTPELKPGMAATVRLIES